jgi:hypothetical protein
MLSMSLRTMSKILSAQYIIWIPFHGKLKNINIFLSAIFEINEKISFGILPRVYVILCNSLRRKIPVYNLQA